MYRKRPIESCSGHLVAKNHTVERQYIGFSWLADKNPTVEISVLNSWVVATVKSFFLAALPGCSSRLLLEAALPRHNAATAQGFNSLVHLLCILCLPKAKSRVLPLPSREMTQQRTPDTGAIIAGALIEESALREMFKLDGSRSGLAQKVCWKVDPEPLFIGSWYNNNNIKSDYFKLSERSRPNKTIE